MTSNPSSSELWADEPSVIHPLFTVAAAEFKAKCLKILDEVRDSGVHVTITKHGHPVAKLVPIEPIGRRASIIGACKGSIAYDDDETF